MLRPDLYDLAVPGSTESESRHCPSLTRRESELRAAVNCNAPLLAEAPAPGPFLSGNAVSGSIFLPLDMGDNKSNIIKCLQVGKHPEEGEEGIARPLRTPHIDDYFRVGISQNTGPQGPPWVAGRPNGKEADS